jgi:hypothetical protein
MKTCITHLLVIVALTFGLSMPAMADPGNNAVKLEGAWVAKVDGLPGQWSYVLSSDPSGKRASGHGSVDIGFNANGVCIGQAEFEQSDTASPILINIVMTGPNTGTYYAIWYGLQDLGPLSLPTNKIVLIGVVKGQLQFVAPGKVLGTHNFELYQPTADTDNDGFPDEGAVAACVFPMSTTDTRLPMPE